MTRIGDPGYSSEGQSITVADLPWGAFPLSLRPLCEAEEGRLAAGMLLLRMQKLKEKMSRIGIKHEDGKWQTDPEAVLDDDE